MRDTISRVPTAPINSAASVRRILTALGTRLASEPETQDIVVAGGSALLAMGLVERATQDVDVVALVGDGGLLTAEQLPDALQHAAAAVARDLDLASDWLNSGPAELLRWGLPAGVEDRWQTETFGEHLTVRWISRLDQIHLKLYAAVDRGGKHVRDLEALQPIDDELLPAARWARTHDPSEGFLEVLVEALAYFGVNGAGLRD